MTKETQPNLYLMDSLRDVTTIGGLKLTKINPAFMTRQISEINKVENDLQFHITSLNPIRPDNKADAWENKALKSFRNGKHELLELVDDDSVAQYRYMAALVTEKSCLKCHAVQGYNEGDIRGGISISFPSRIYKQSENARLFHLLIAHFLILIVGLFGIYSYFKMEQHLFTIIHEKNQELESDTKLLRQTNEELLKINTEKNKFISGDLASSWLWFYPKSSVGQSTNSVTANNYQLKRSGMLLKRYFVQHVPLCFVQMIVDQDGRLAGNGICLSQIGLYGDRVGLEISLNEVSNVIDSIKIYDNERGVVASWDGEATHIDILSAKAVSSDVRMLLSTNKIQGVFAKEYAGRISSKPLCLYKKLAERRIDTTFPIIPNLEGQPYAYGVQVVFSKDGKKVDNIEVYQNGEVVAFWRK